MGSKCLCSHWYDGPFWNQLKYRTHQTHWLGIQELKEQHRFLPMLTGVLKDQVLEVFLQPLLYLLVLEVLSFSSFLLQLLKHLLKLFRFSLLLPWLEFEFIRLTELLLWFLLVCQVLSFLLILVKNSLQILFLEEFRCKFMLVMLLHS